MSHSPYAQYLPRAWRPNHGLGVASSVLHIVAGAASILQVWSILHLHSRVRAYRRGEITAHQLTHATNHYFALNALPSLFAVASLVVWIVLLFRMVRNREAIGRPNATFNAGWAIAGPLVPFVSAVVPWLQMNELWKASHPDDPPMSPTWKSRQGSPLINGWWALALGGQVLALFGSGAVLSAMFAGIGDLSRGNDLVSIAEKLVEHNLQVFVAATLVTGTANVVGGVAIRALVDRQERYASRWHLDAPMAWAPTPLVPPGWYPDPAGRHQHRWWDGVQWTETVADNGVTAREP